MKEWEQQPTDEQNFPLCVISMSFTTENIADYRKSLDGPCKMAAIDDIQRSLCHYPTVPSTRILREDQHLWGNCPLKYSDRCTSLNWPSITNLLTCWCWQSCLGCRSIRLSSPGHFCASRVRLCKYGRYKIHNRLLYTAVYFAFCGCATNILCILT